MGCLRCREEKTSPGPSPGPGSLCQVELSHSALCCRTLALLAAPWWPRGQIHGPASALFLGAREALSKSVSGPGCCPSVPPRAGLAWPRVRGRSLTVRRLRLQPLPGHASFSPPPVGTGLGRSRLPQQASRLGGRSDQRAPKMPSSSKTSGLLFTKRLKKNDSLRLNEYV